MQRSATTCIKESNERLISSLQGQMAPGLAMTREEHYGTCAQPQLT